MVYNPEERFELYKQARAQKLNWADVSSGKVQVQKFQDVGLVKESVGPRVDIETKIKQIYDLSEATVTESDYAKKQREEKEKKKSDRPADWVTDLTKEIKIPEKPIKGGDKSVVPDYKKEN